MHAYTVASGHTSKARGISRRWMDVFVWVRVRSYVLPVGFVSRACCYIRVAIAYSACRSCCYIDLSAICLLVPFYETDSKYMCMYKNT